MSASSYTEDTLVQQTHADYLENQLGWVSVYAYSNKVFGLNILFGHFTARRLYE